VKELVLDDIEAPAGVRATLLEGGQSLETTREGKRLKIRIPDSVAMALPPRQAYVLKIAGAR
jgi:alpha-L-fucosidase